METTQTPVSCPRLSSLLGSPQRRAPRHPTHLPLLLACRLRWAGPEGAASQVLGDEGPGPGGGGRKRETGRALGGGGWSAGPLRSEERAGTLSTRPCCSDFSATPPRPRGWPVTRRASASGARRVPASPRGRPMGVGRAAASCARSPGRCGRAGPLSRPRRSYRRDPARPAPAQVSAAVAGALTAPLPLRTGRGGRG